MCRLGDYRIFDHVPETDFGNIGKGEERMKLYAIFDKNGKLECTPCHTEDSAWTVSWFVDNETSPLDEFKTKKQSEGYTCEEVEIVRVKK